MAIGRGELLEQVLALARHDLAQDVADAVLHRDVALVREVPLERLAQVPALGAEDLVDLPPELVRDLLGALRKPGLNLASRPLELVTDEVGVGAGLLALEHPRADLDGVGDDAGQILSRLLALADEPNSALVGHDQTVDHHAIPDDCDVRVPQRCGGFHNSVSR